MTGASIGWRVWLGRAALVWAAVSGGWFAGARGLRSPGAVRWSALAPLGRGYDTASTVLFGLAVVLLAVGGASVLGRRGPTVGALSVSAFLFGAYALAVIWVSAAVGHLDGSLVGLSVVLAGVPTAIAVGVGATRAGGER